VAGLLPGPADIKPVGHDGHRRYVTRRQTRRRPPRRWRQPGPRHRGGGLPPRRERFNALDTVGSEILARREELGRLLSREEGKTLPEGIAEATRAGYIFKFFAGRR